LAAHRFEGLGCSVYDLPLPPRLDHNHTGYELNGDQMGAGAELIKQTYMGAAWETLVVGIVRAEGEIACFREYTNLDGPLN
jgi:hypothetical protein